MTIQEFIKDEMLDLFRSESLRDELEEVFGFDNVISYESNFNKRIAVVRYNDGSGNREYTLTYGTAHFTGGLTQYYLESIN